MIEKVRSVRKITRENVFMKGVLTLTPLPQGGRPDRQTPKIYIYIYSNLRDFYRPLSNNNRSIFI
jgi:hypothetical protein